MLDFTIAIGDADNITFKIIPLDLMGLNILKNEYSLLMTYPTMYQTGNTMTHPFFCFVKLSPQCLIR